MLALNSVWGILIPFMPTSPNMFQILNRYANFDKNIMYIDIDHEGAARVDVNNTPPSMINPS